MKSLTKAISSSPGRTTTMEKFPPPLMRFLRSNVGNKSHRRKSRASHMLFLKKKNTTTLSISTQQEPSSPKVTCIGQVRVRRHKKHKTTVAAAAAPTGRRRNRFCRCIRKIKPCSFLTVLTKWVFFFPCGYCKDSCFFHHSVKKNQEEEKKQEKKQEQEQEQERGTVEKDDEDDMNNGYVSQQPPKNALLLTRCRSAPYRSSSLANKLLESTVENKSEEELIEKLNKLEIKNEEKEEINEIKDVPLILSRCKSEPARTWDQIIV